MAKNLTPSAVTPVVAFDASCRGDLDRLIVSCETLADEVAEKVNPTNIYAIRYRNMANEARELIALFETRGHTGVPKEDN